MQEVVQQIVNALALGSIYALVALGLGILFSILGLVNFAHGELLTVAGFTLWLLTSNGVPWTAAVLVALMTPVIAALLMERSVFRPMRGAPATALLLASFALSVVLQNVFAAAFGAKARGIPYPEWVSASFEIAGIRLAWLDIVTFGLTASVLYALMLFLRRTTLGIALRAAAEDFTITRAMGVRADRVVVSAFAISGFLAAIAGILWLAGSGSVVATSGFVPLVKGFIAAVVGGLGSLVGAVAGGFLIAALEVASRAYLPESLRSVSDAIVFGVLIVVLLLRPAGLFPTRERTA
jgi:branched-chain amino acid transport system permease protein